MMKELKKFKTFFVLMLYIVAVVILVRYMNGFNNQVDLQLLKYKRPHNLRFWNKTKYNMLPSNSEIDKMDEDTLYLTFDRYINQKQAECKQISRAGPSNDYGKNICLDHWKSPNTNCLVYSFGSQFKFGFENAIIKSYQCEVHTFDPSMSTEGRVIPKGINFHLTGLSGKDENTTIQDRIWQMRTLSTIIMSLHHSERKIDILKIDIEGWEWKALPQMLQSGALDNVRQLCLEVHFGYSIATKTKDNKSFSYSFLPDKWGNVAIAEQLKILKDLHDYGFRIFMFDPIRFWASRRLKKTKKVIDTLVEISLVNLTID